MSTNSLKKKVLFQLPVKLKPIYYGTQPRILGILKYFNDRRDRLSVDVVVANQWLKESYITPKWDDEQTQEALKFVDNVFIYEARRNLLEFLYTRSKIFYYQVLWKEQMPIDTDFYSPPGYVNYVRSLGKRNTYDFAWINTVNFAHLAKPFQSTSTKTIIDTHDIMCRLRKVLKDVLNYKGLKFDYDLNFEKEVQLLNTFDVVISDSNYEFTTLKNYLSADKLSSIPHCVDVLGSDAELIPYQERNFKYDLLFLGMSNPQNVDAMKFFLGEIFPSIVKGKPDVRLAIAGKISNDIQNICNDLQVDPQLLQNIEIMGYVPDLSALYYGARLMLCPVRTGGGTNMRLVEAMSYSLPIITTRQCAGALSMQNNVNALITDDPVEYTEYVLQALADPQRAQQISHEIKQTYDRQYAKSVIYEQLDTLFGIN